MASRSPGWCRVIFYPNFVEAVEDIDPEDLAAVSGVPANVIDRIVAGGVVVSPETRQLLAAALDRDEIELWRDVSMPSGADLATATASAPSTYITDPNVLRIIDHRSRRQ